MRVLIQRSLKSQVTVDDKIVGQITKGLVVLVGFTYNDTVEDMDYLVKKIINLRVFDDAEHVMNKSILDIKGEILLVSQFTLYADTKKGNRPSYINALKSSEALPLYEQFIAKLQEYVPVATGIFGADMQVAITNDGPVTIMLDSKAK